MLVVCLQQVFPTSCLWQMQLSTDQSAQQTPVSDKCSRTACILGMGVRAHHTAAPWPSLVYGCPSGLSLNSLCSPSVACSVWLPYCAVWHASCAVWRTLTHDDDCVPHRHPRSKYHRRVMLPSATVPLASPLRVYGTLCRPTSRHHHHCLSSSDI